MSIIYPKRLIPNQEFLKLEILPNQSLRAASNRPCWATISAAQMAHGQFALKTVHPLASVGDVKASVYWVR